MKVSAKNYFQQLQQKLQADASTIDNYLEQRVQILQNVAPLVNKAIDLDKDVMKTVAAYRGGARITDENRNEISQNLDRSFGRLFPQVEAYPDLKAHKAIADAMQQNDYLQREITAAQPVQRHGKPVEYRRLRMAHQDDCRSPFRLHHTYSIYCICRNKGSCTQHVLLSRNGRHCLRPARKLSR